MKISSSESALLLMCQGGSELQIHRFCWEDFSVPGTLAIICQKVLESLEKTKALLVSTG